MKLSNAIQHETSRKHVDALRLHTFDAGTNSVPERDGIDPGFAHPSRAQPVSSGEVLNLPSHAYVLHGPELHPHPYDQGESWRMDGGLADKAPDDSNADFDMDPSWITVPLGHEPLSERPSEHGVFAELFDEAAPREARATGIDGEYKVTGPFDLILIVFGQILAVYSPLSTILVVTGRTRVPRYV
jgi:hypothetical protein